jgi:hypothetical protein
MLYSTSFHHLPSWFTCYSLSSIKKEGVLQITVVQTYTCLYAIVPGTYVHTCHVLVVSICLQCNYYLHPTVCHLLMFCYVRRSLWCAWMFYSIFCWHSYVLMSSLPRTLTPWLHASIDQASTVLISLLSCYFLSEYTMLFFFLFSNHSIHHSRMQCSFSLTLHIFLTTKHHHQHFSRSNKLPHDSRLAISKVVLFWKIAHNLIIRPRPIFPVFHLPRAASIGAGT